MSKPNILIMMSDEQDPAVFSTKFNVDLEPGDGRLFKLDKTPD